MEFGILLSRKEEVEKALVAISKRAERKGIPGVFSWTWGKAYQSSIRVTGTDGTPLVAGAKRCGVDWELPVVRVPLTIEGETPRFSGWRFIGTLQHLDDENIVRSLPGEKIPAVYRSRRECDHCHTSRRRIDTYVLQHDDGRYVQVGSTCLRDFLGSNEVAAVAARAELLALAVSVASDDAEGGGTGGGTGGAERLLSDFLAIAAWVVRTSGWVSKTAARERNCSASATAAIAWKLLVDAKEYSEAQCEPSDEDEALAEDAAVWAESITDDVADNYLHNLRAVARTGLVSDRTAGIAASTIVAYQRHIGQVRLEATRAAARLVATYVGNVGDKVAFGLVKKGKRNGVSVSNDEPVVLEFTTGYETSYGYTTILKFRTGDGNILLWKATSDPGISREDVGKRFTVAGTIKEHSEYKGEKQTILTRCKVTAVTPA